MSFNSLFLDKTFLKLPNGYNRSKSNTFFSILNIFSFKKVKVIEGLETEVQFLVFFTLC